MLKTTCSKCALPNDRLPQKYCRVCHATNMRAWRPKHKDLPEEARKKANARAYVNVYLKRKKIEKKPCEVCLNEKAEKHHEDYNKPLDVKWLCRPCHLAHHKIT